jgi:hypothetical protein
MTTERERGSVNALHCAQTEGGGYIIPIFTERDRERYRDRERDSMDRNFVFAQGGRKTYCFLEWNVFIYVQGACMRKIKIKATATTTTNAPPRTII